MNQPAPLRYATLCLGTRSDAAAWEKGCNDLGLTKAFSCIKAKVTTDDVMGFLGAGADWAFMAGHSGGDDLYGEFTRPTITFKADAITIYEQHKGPSRTLRTNDPAFRMRPLKLVVFAGCAPFTHRGGGCAPVLRELFGGAAILGTETLTGPEMMKMMLGGVGSVRGFFGHYASLRDPVKAWMEAARGIYGGGPPMPHKEVSVEDNFRALDASGQHWKVSNKQVVTAPPVK